MSAVCANRHRWREAVHCTPYPVGLPRQRFICRASPWLTPAQPINTPFVSVPGLLTAECISNEQGSYLAVTVHGDPADPRTDDIVGDVVRDGQVQADWGLHLIDVHLAMGNLIDIVRQQSRSYLSKKKK